MNYSRVYVIALIALALWAQSCSTAPPPACNNLCRHRHIFWSCNSGPCIKWTLPTCWGCNPTQLGICVENDDSLVGFQRCAIPTLGTDWSPYRRYNECDLLCACAGGASTVEAKNPNDEFSNNETWLYQCLAN